MTARDPAVSGPVRSGQSGSLVVVIEHEPEVGDMARRYLERARFPVRVTADPAEAIVSVSSRLATAYVIDLTMPGLDIRLVRRALASGTAASVVFLLGARAARPRGLGSGPGERRWLVRPFSPRTLVETVREVLTPPLEPVARKLVAEAELTPGELAVLTALADAKGRVVSREQLLTVISQGRGKIPGPRVVDVYVAQLRAKLGAGSIRTVRSAGYAISDHISYESWLGKPKANSRGAAPQRDAGGASIA